MALWVEGGECNPTAAATERGTFEKSFQNSWSCVATVVVTRLPCGRAMECKRGVSVVTTSCLVEGLTLVVKN